MCYPKLFFAKYVKLTRVFQSHNAMENWGLITYRTIALLYDEDSSDARHKNWVAYVVAHGKS